MLLPNEAIELRLAIAELVEAEINNSWKGGGDPADIPEIEADLNKARDRVNALIALLQIPMDEKYVNS